jgi:hypothetical protein
MASFRRKFDPSLFKYRKGSGGEVVRPDLRGKGKYGEGRNIEGYYYQGSSPFRYKTPSGQTRTVQPGERLSSRQYQNLRYESTGWKSKSQYERISHNSATVAGRKRLTYKSKGRRVHEIGAYRAWAQIYSETHGTDLRTTLNPTSDYSYAFAQALQDDFSDLTPDGPFADLLTLVGLRDDSAEWNVGETP